MKIPPTNIVKGKGTRRNPEAGDLFVFRMEQFPERFYFGRVVATDTSIGNMPGGVILIYIYRNFSSEKKNIPLLNPVDLLVPPVGTNALPWTRGYFEVIKSGCNEEGDLLPQHCFFGPPIIKGGEPRYFDEYSRRLSMPVEPVGFYGLSGMGAIDDDISKALGVPLKQNPVSQ
ncbi:Imm26 family immunity protein [Andreprevotia lacus]|jgi:hypothetical protein|uniref:Imm26 family immunity protein n=1 Tax=Andreprevotia lacus TaxID=1121000 RepID=UPI000A01F5D3|nr:Imm26 family immunity protein [Andreprevotia lacus]